MSTTVRVQRLSSLTLLKLLLIGGAVFWTLYIAGSFIYLLVVGDLELPYSLNGEDKFTSLGTGVKLFFVLAFLVAAFDLMFMIGIWVVASIGLWMYSKFRPISISFVEVDD